jgi:hypothetical protein
MQEVYSSVGLEEKRAATASVIRLVPPPEISGKPAASEESVQKSGTAVGTAAETPDGHRSLASKWPSSLGILERDKGFEPSTFSLGTRTGASASYALFTRKTIPCSTPCRSRATTVGCARPTFFHALLLHCRHSMRGSRPTADTKTDGAEGLHLQLVDRDVHIHLDRVDPLRDSSGHLLTDTKAAKYAAIGAGLALLLRLPLPATLLVASGGAALGATQPARRRRLHRI